MQLYGFICCPVPFTSPRLTVDSIHDRFILPCTISMRHMQSCGFHFLNIVNSSLMSINTPSSGGCGIDISTLLEWSQVEDILPLDGCLISNNVTHNGIYGTNGARQCGWNIILGCVLISTWKEPLSSLFRQNFALSDNMLNLQVLDWAASTRNCGYKVDIL